MHSQFVRGPGRMLGLSMAAFLTIGGVLISGNGAAVPALEDLLEGEDGPAARRCTYNGDGTRTCCWRDQWGYQMCQDQAYGCGNTGDRERQYCGWWNVGQARCAHP
ncbi:MAG: hypothetical protein ACT4PT_07945 [Methanobacteriota archaeon]